MPFYFIGEESTIEDRAPDGNGLAEGVRNSYLQLAGISMLKKHLYALLPLRVESTMIHLFLSAHILTWNDIK